MVRLKQKGGTQPWCVLNCFSIIGNPPLPPPKTGEPETRLSTDGLKEVHYILRDSEAGFYYGTDFHRRMHYEISSAQMAEFESSALGAGLVPQRLSAGKSYKDVEGCDFLVGDGSQCTGLIIDSLQLDVIARDSLCPKPGFIAKRDPLRGNRGFSIGFVSSQGCTVSDRDNPKGICDGVAVPGMAKGSRRYPGLWYGMNQLHQYIFNNYKLPRPFQDKLRRERWVESLSFRLYLHEKTEIENGLELLGEDYDRNNCPLPGQSGCLVVYKDIFLHYIGRWSTVVVIATSRKSVVVKGCRFSVLQVQMSTPGTTGCEPRYIPS